MIIIKHILPISLIVNLFQMIKMAVAFSKVTCMNICISDYNNNKKIREIGFPEILIKSAFLMMIILLKFP